MIEASKLKLTVITSTMGLIPAIAAPIPALQVAGGICVFAKSSAQIASLRLPHQENTLIILQCFAQPLFERFAIGSFFLAAFSIFRRY
jgi:hypothetical protein